MKELSKNSTITYVNDKGEKKVCNILFQIDKKDKNYLIYTDNTTDENGDLRTFASYYKPGSENIELLSIEDENDWKLIEKFLSSLVEKSIKE